jgi:hypothetical protein
MAQPGGSGFSKSELPGDRNALILAQAQYQKRYEIKKVAYRSKGSLRAADEDVPDHPDHPMVELTLQGESGPQFPYLVDQVIFCIGGNPVANAAIANLVHSSLVNGLEPLKDQNRMVSDGTGVLAWATPNRNLIIVGSATFNFQSQAYDKKPQAAPMAYLPPNAQVPDGIAVAISTIEALNAYMPVKPIGLPRDASFKAAASQPVQWNINFNTSNRTQIAAYLASTSDTDPFTANLQVATILYLRSKNNFGLSEDQITFVMKSIADNVAFLRRSISHFDERRKFQERTLGVDKRLNDYLDVYTKGTAWKSHWASAGINC